MTPERLAEIERAYAKVALFPEKRTSGLGDLLALRNVVPDLIAALRDSLARERVLRDMCAKQADDDGLWFMAKYASEAYLQQELRKLHAAIEGETAQPEKVIP